MVAFEKVTIAELDTLLAKVYRIAKLDSLLHGYSVCCCTEYKMLWCASISLLLIMELMIDKLDCSIMCLERIEYAINGSHLRQPIIVQRAHKFSA